MNELIEPKNNSPASPSNGLVLEAGVNYTYGEIIDLINVHGNITITIPLSSLDALKKGLAVRKSRKASRMADKGLFMEKTILSYDILKSHEIEGTNVIDLRITLKNRSAVPVFNVQVPGDF